MDLDMEAEIAEFRNQLHAHAEESIEERVAHPRQARITGYNPATPHLVKVLLLPEGDFPLGPPGSDNVFETGWVQYAPVAAGAGWGLYAPPCIGDQVSVTFQEHDGDNPLVQARHNDDNHLPPTGYDYKSGEIIGVNKFGVTLYMRADGTFTMTAPAQTGFNLIGNGTLRGNWEVKGTLLVDELITAAGGLSATGSEGVIIATGDIVAGYGSGAAVSELQHVHSGVTRGGDDTGPPVGLVGTMRRRAIARLAARKRPRP